MAVFGGISSTGGKGNIAGGLISDKEDIIAALDAGAASISTTKEELWFL